MRGEDPVLLHCGQSSEQRQDLDMRRMVFAQRFGAVADLAKIERQALARYTNDAGNHVSIELRPAATLVLN